MNPFFKTHLLDSRGDTVVKNLPASAGDTGSVPGLGRSHMHGAAEPVCHTTESALRSLLQPPKPGQLDPVLHCPVEKPLQ